MPASAAKQLALAVLEGATLDAIDAEVIRDLGDEPSDPDAADRDLEARLLAKRGDAPGLGVLFEQVADDVDASWEQIATSFAELCDSGDSSAESDGRRRSVRRGLVSLDRRRHASVGARCH